MKRQIFIASAIVLSSFSVSAQEQNDLLNDLVTCRSIENRDSRLDCFEANLARALNERSKQEERRAEVKTRTEARAKDNFGLSERAAERAAAENKQSTRETEQAYIPEAEPEQLTATIDKADKNAVGKWIVHLDNGQIWQETSASGFFGKVKARQSARIEPGRFGGYRMYVDDKKRPLAVKRVK